MICEYLKLIVKERVRMMDFNEIFGIDELDLYYKAEVVGFDGENFTYNVYYDTNVEDTILDDVQNAVESMIKSLEEEDEYCGYIDITKEEDRISIFHDLGGMESEEDNAMISKLLIALNNVKGIKNVMINEDSY